MIAFVRGKIAYSASEHIIIDVNGIGYQVFIPSNLLYQLSLVGQEVELHTYFHVKEDQMQLFGFLELDDKKMFELLLEVSGIGPKLALGILSATTKDALVQSIIDENIAHLTQLPGVGKKTAQRLILELKDKIAKSDLATSQEKVEPKRQYSAYNDSLQALLSLGYSQKEIEPVLQEISSSQVNEPSSDTLIKLVLQQLGKK